MDGHENKRHIESNEIDEFLLYRRFVCKINDLNFQGMHKKREKKTEQILFNAAIRDFKWDLTYFLPCSSMPWNDFSWFSMRQTKIYLKKQMPIQISAYIHELIFICTTQKQLDTSRKKRTANLLQETNCQLIARVCVCVEKEKPTSLLQTTTKNQRQSIFLLCVIAIRDGMWNFRFCQCKAQIRARSACTFFIFICFTFFEVFFFCFRSLWDDALLFYSSQRLHEWV